MAGGGEDGHGGENEYGADAGMGVEAGTEWALARTQRRGVGCGQKKGPAERGAPAGQQGGDDAMHSASLLLKSRAPERRGASQPLH